jgi:hypothetical protein
MKTLPPLLLPFIQRPSPALRSYFSAKPRFSALERHQSGDCVVSLRPNACVTFPVGEFPAVMERGNA